MLIYFRKSNEEQLGSETSSLKVPQSSIDGKGYIYTDKGVFGYGDPTHPLPDYDNNSTMVREDRARMNTRHSLYGFPDHNQY